MPPEALKAYIESLAARSEADAREFMKRHGFDMDAPVEYPPSPPGVGRLMDHDPIPENTPVGQIPLILQEISGDFRKRFDDLAKKHNIDPHALIPEEKRMPFSNAAELERHLRNTGYDNPEMFEDSAGLTLSIRRLTLGWVSILPFSEPPGRHSPRMRKKKPGSNERGKLPVMRNSGNS